VSCQPQPPREGHGCLSLDAAITATLVERQVDIVFLAGYLKRLGPSAVAAFPERVHNTHPALLPKFGGQGMFGDHWLGHQQ
jgi:phosphoribosylglycinamide formyltransferase-1